MEFPLDLSDLSNRNILECCGMSPVPKQLSVCTADQFVSLLNNVISALNTQVILINNSSLAPLFFLAALHQSPGSWQSPATRELSTILLQHIYTAYDTDEIFSFLSTQIEESCVLSELFKPIQQLITTKQWEFSPTVKLLAAWLQSKCSYPLLGAYIHLFLPIVLRLLDDLSPDNQLIGLHSTSHMISNVTKAELLVYNRDEVLLSALERFIYTDHSQILLDYQLVMVKLLSLMEQSPSKSLSPETLGLTRHDSHLSCLLSTISLSSTIELKRVRIKMLSRTVVLFNSALLPHLSQLVKAIEFFLSLPDLPSERVRFETMDLILFICQHCYQQIHVHLFPLTLALIKLITQCSGNKQDRTAKSDTYRLLAEKSITCFQRLYACGGCGDVLLGYLVAVCQTEGGSEFVASILRRTITRVSIANYENLSIAKDAI